MAQSAPKNLRLRINLNLLHPQGIPQKLPQKFLHWLLQYGRFIVVFVEIIVVTAFIMRFKLDADLANLSNQINTDLPFIKGKADDESLIINTQLRLQTIKSSYNEADFWEKMILKVNSKIPIGVSFNNLTIEKIKTPFSMTFKINGVANSNGDLSYFLNNLKQDPDLKDVSLSSISFNQEQVIFSISGALK